MKKQIIIMMLLSSSLFLQAEDKTGEPKGRHEHHTYHEHRTNDGFIYHEHHAYHYDDSTISEDDRKQFESDAFEIKSDVCKQLAAYLEGHNSNAQLISTNLSDGRPTIKLTYQVKSKDDHGNEIVSKDSVKSTDLLTLFKLCVESTPELVKKLEEEIEKLQPKS